MHLRRLLTSKTQVNDITNVQLEDPNKSNIITYIYSLLTKYNINLSVKQIALYTKNSWNKLITNKINEKVNIMYLNESNKLRRLHHLNKFKKSIKLEKYLTKLQQSDAIVIFKLRTRMTNLENNFHRKYQDNNCPRCLPESDDEEHLFSSCSQLGSLYQKYRITNYYEVFENNVTIERYKEIVSFMREIGIEEQ